MTFPCPCCGQPIPDRPSVEDLLLAPITPTAKRIVAVLIEEYPLELSWRQITAKVYGDRLPASGENATRVTTNKANKILAKYGWCIGASHHRGSGSVALRPIA